ncbi:MAG: hypothetical protein DRR08_16000 [Candidatus Parabeggiatoa sp. nov. 2]|nr:MAG: hypothetical protein B6247_13135 [Beggiatoa sp. 4572_84]RKZ58603.1 MAG: hypothetical protein DRR08_16000 [Gammaproteobacteria bacterium]HEC84176.1 hypothetical protein [Thioploca sp.]
MISFAPRNFCRRDCFYYLLTEYEPKWDQVIEPLELPFHHPTLKGTGTANAIKLRRNPFLSGGVFSCSPKVGNMLPTLLLNAIKFIRGDTGVLV